MQLLTTIIQTIPLCSLPSQNFHCPIMCIPFKESKMPYLMHPFKEYEFSHPVHYFKSILNPLVHSLKWILITLSCAFPSKTPICPILIISFKGSPLLNPVYSLQRMPITQPVESHQGIPFEPRNPLQMITITPHSVHSLQQISFTYAFHSKILPHWNPFKES